MNKLMKKLEELDNKLDICVKISRENTQDLKEINQAVKDIKTYIE